MIPKPGDGLFFMNHERPEEQFGFALNTVPARTGGEIQLAVPQPVSPGTRVYITSSLDLAAHARQIIGRPARALRHPVPLDLTVRVEEDGRLILDGCIHTGSGRVIPLTHAPGITLVAAASRPLTAEQMEQQVRKSGGTPFVIDTVTMQYRGNLFAPLADLNRARREFLALAESALVAASLPPAELVEQAKSCWQERAGNYPATGTAIFPIKPMVPLRLALYVDTPDTVRAAVESGCDLVYFEPDIPVSGSASCSSHALTTGVEEQIKAAVELCRAHDIPLVWKFPG